MTIGYLILQKFVWVLDNFLKLYIMDFHLEYRKEQHQMTIWISYLDGPYLL